MFTAAAVHTAIDFHSLSVSIQLFAFRPDMAQFPSIMADVIMLIFKDSICHVGILPDVLFVCPCLPLLMVLKFDIAPDPILFQIQQVFLTAVAAVSSNCFQHISKRVPVLFQNRDQRIIVCPVIAHISMDNKVILYCDLDIVCRL